MAFSGALLLVFLVIFSVLLGQTAAQQSVNIRAPQVSPRFLALENLRKDGCTNLLVAHYILDASRSSIPATILIARLAGTTGFNRANIAKW